MAAVLNIDISFEEELSPHNRQPLLFYASRQPHFARLMMP
jgi:hypothetical protein